MTTNNQLCPPDAVRISERGRLQAGLLLPKNMSTEKQNYIDFLLGKVPQAEVSGFDPPSPCHHSLFPHQMDICEWAIRGGRRAIFASFGLGKTRMHLQLAKWVCEKTNGSFLIICPLGVRQEFTQSDGPAMGMNLKFIRQNEEIEQPGIYVTNYESVRDGKIDVNGFQGVGMDEASVLRSFGSKTYQTFLPLFKAVPYRFVFTATPSPNRYKELIHYGGFLGIMDTGEALTRFFQRDSSQANNLTLYSHMEKQFWLWLASWAAFIQRPSDLGYSDSGYDLPAINVQWHRLQDDHTQAWSKVDSWGQAQLLNDQSIGLKDSAETKRATIKKRIERAKELIDDNGLERHWLVWHDLESERDAIEKQISEAKTVYGSQDLEKREELIMGFSRGEYRILATKPIIAGSGCNFQRHCSDAIFLGVGYKFNDFIQAIHRIHRFQQPEQVNIHIIHMESEDAIVEELKAKWSRHEELQNKMTAIMQEYKLSTHNSMELIRTMLTGGERTEIKSNMFKAIRNDCVLELMPVDFGNNFAHNPNHDGSTKEMARSQPGSETPLRPKLPQGESRAIESGEAGILPSEQRESLEKSGRLEEIESRETKSCNQEIQREECRSLRGSISGMVSEKQRESIGSSESSPATQHLRTHNERVQCDDGKAESQMPDMLGEAGNEKSSSGSLPQQRQSEGDSLQLVQLGTRTFQGQYGINDEGDSVSSKAWPDNCVDMILTSIPFGNQYEYSPSYHDLGCNSDNDEFFKQMEFLTPNLLRVLKPGRIAAIHVKDRIRFGNVTGDGFPTVDPFSDMTTAAFRSAGFRLIARITIDTDVVRENNQTYRLGWSENAKDSSKMGAGMPEYVLVFRKLPSDQSNGYADVPVCKPKEEYTRADWQLDAAGLWRSNGNRLPDPEVMKHMSHEAIKALWIEYSKQGGYSHDQHAELAKALEGIGKLPSSFMLFPAISRNKDIWTDIARMRTLNSEQTRRNQENHVCPLQLDIIKRLITRYSNKGEIVYDPFGGIGSVPFQAIKMERQGWMTELNEEYWKNAVGYCEMAENEVCVPTLFDLASAL